MLSSLLISLNLLSLLILLSGSSMILEATRPNSSFKLTNFFLLAIFGSSSSSSSSSIFDFFDATD